MYFVHSYEFIPEDKNVISATTDYNDPEMLVEISKGLGASMPGLDVRTMPEDQKLAQRGW